MGLANFWVQQSLHSDFSAMSLRYGAWLCFVRLLFYLRCS